MITKEEIEKLQRLQYEKSLLKEDYNSIRLNGVDVRDSYLRFHYNYDKAVKIAIKSRIRIVEKKIDKLIQESEEK